MAAGSRSKYSERICKISSFDCWFFYIYICKMQKKKSLQAEKNMKKKLTSLLKWILITDYFPRLLNEYP